MIGKIVHYIDTDDQHYPALVLWSEEPSFEVFAAGTGAWLILLVWDRSGNTSLKQQVACDPTAKHPKTWHQPE